MKQFLILLILVGALSAPSAFGSDYDVGFSDGFDAGCDFAQSDIYDEGFSEGDETGTLELGDFLVEKANTTISKIDLKDLIIGFIYLWER